MAEGISWKRTEFFQNMRRLAARYPTAAEQCAGQVAVQVLNDAIMQGPTVPMLTGNLRSSGTFEVVAVSDMMVRIYVGFNTPYAAKVHEMPVSTHWTTAGSGPKYLEAKLVAHKDEYIRVWARKMAQALGMAGSGGGLAMAAGGGAGAG